MCHANYQAPGKRDICSFHSRPFWRGKHGQAEKWGCLLITKTPLTESSMPDCLMNPRPTRATLSTNQHQFRLSEEWLSERDSQSRRLQRPDRALLEDSANYSLEPLALQGPRKTGFHYSKVPKVKWKAPKTQAPDPQQRWSWPSCFYPPSQTQKRCLAGHGIEFFRWLLRLTHWPSMIPYHCSGFCKFIIHTEETLLYKPCQGYRPFKFPTKKLKKFMAVLLDGEAK